MTSPRTWPALLALTLLSTTALAGKPHQHGVVKLDAALEGSTLTLQMQAPLDSLLGFERRPRNEAERKAADEVAKRLREPASLFVPPPAAGCAPGATTVDDTLLRPPAPGAKADEPRGGHADLEAGWTFTCRDVGKLDAVDLKLFDAFRRIERVELQYAGPKGQAKQTLTRARPRLTLPR